MSIPDIMIGRTRDLTHDTPTSAHHVIIARAELQDRRQDIAVAVTVLGAVIDGRSFAATAEGYRQLITWGQCLGCIRQAGVEGTGSYGAGLTRALRGAGIEVAEINRPDRSAGRQLTINHRLVGLYGP